MILDQYGRPVRRQMLDKELAAPAVSGIRSLWNFEQVATGLTPRGLARLLRDANDGDHTAYLTLAEEMEERDPHYAAVLGTRKRAVSGLPVVVESASDDAGDIKLADEVRALLNTRGARTLMEDCLDGLGKGYSVVEIMWDRSVTPWVPARYVWRDPRFFVFDRATRSEVRLRDEADMLDGLPLEPYKFITHVPRLKSGTPIRGGLARVVVWAWMFKTYGIKDWMAFAEVFGMPLRVGTYRPGETQSNIDILKMAVAGLGIDAAAVIPEGMQIKFESMGNTTGAAELFEALADWMDGQISKAVLGQTMTVDDGSSLAQAQIHNEVRHDIRDADAGQLAETLARDLIIPYIVLNYGPQKAYPRLCLRAPKSADVTILSDALAKLVPLGLEVEASEVRDRLGFSDPAAGAKCLAAPQLMPQDESAPPSARNRTQNRFTGEQQAIEDLVAGVIPRGVSGFERFRAAVDEAIRSAKSYEDLQVLLAALMDAPDDPAQEILTRSFIATDLHGREAVRRED